MFHIPGADVGAAKVRADVSGIEVTAGAEDVTCCPVDGTMVVVTGMRAHFLAAVRAYPVLQGPSQVPGPSALHADDVEQFTSHAAQPNANKKLSRYAESGTNTIAVILISGNALTVLRRWTQDEIVVVFLRPTRDLALGNRVIFRSQKYCLIACHVQVVSGLRQA